MMKASTAQSPHNCAGSSMTQVALSPAASEFSLRWKPSLSQMSSVERGDRGVMTWEDSHQSPHMDIIPPSKQRSVARLCSGPRKDGCKQRALHLSHSTDGHTTVFSTKIERKKK